MAAAAMAALAEQVTRLCDLGPEDSVTAVSWTQRGSHLAVATAKGQVQLWEAATCRNVSASVCLCLCVCACVRVSMCAFYWWQQQRAGAALGGRHLSQRNCAHSRCNLHPLIV
jgi:Anaphase-promoting complex subunit 4 WD40 domain